MRKIVLGIACILVALCCSAQTTDWPLDTINGQVVYRYIVQKSEGLYRISKNFGVTQEALLRLNPSLQTEGLRQDQVIYVPYVAKIDSTQYVTHTLQPKETLYGLSRQYGVTVKELEDLNPETSKRMEIGSTLLIKKREEAPVVEVAVAKAEEKAEEIAEKTEPVVEKAQEAIEPVKEDVTENAEKQKEELKKLHLSAKDLQEGRRKQAERDADIVPVIGKEIALDADRLATADSLNNSNDSAEIMPAMPIRLVYMLPFMTDATKREASIDRFIDFYEGSLIAIYEAQQEGQPFDIYTYDVEKSDVATQQILQRSELMNADAIIGPAYPAQVSYASLYAKQNRIPMLIPFTSKVSGLEHNPYLIQFNPSATLEAAALINELMPRRDSINFVYVDAFATDLGSAAKALQTAANDSGFMHTQTTIRAILSDSLGQALVADKENILVFNSDKYSSVQVVMNRILNQKANHQLTLWGRYSWANENCILPMIYTSIFHELEPTELANYSALYQRYFGHDLSAENPRFDLLGYDLTRAMIQNISESRQALQDDACDQVYANERKGIQSDCSFIRSAEGAGRINNAIRVIRK